MGILLWLAPLTGVNSLFSVDPRLGHYQSSLIVLCSVCIISKRSPITFALNVISLGGFTTSTQVLVNHYRQREHGSVSKKGQQAFLNRRQRQKIAETITTEEFIEIKPKIFIKKEYCVNYQLFMKTCFLLRSGYLMLYQRRSMSIRSACFLMNKELFINFIITEREDIALFYVNS